MMKYTVATIIAWVFLVWQSLLLGQDTLFIHGLAQMEQDHIKIRWAPDKALLWQYANQAGYQVERVTLKDENGNSLTPKARLASAKKWEIILPQSPEIWKKMIDTSEIAGMGAAALYGEELSVEELSDSPILETYQRSKVEETRFGFGLLAADQDWNVALAMGLGMIDDEVSLNKTYLYTIYPAQVPSSFQVQAANMVVEAAPQPSLPSPTGLRASFGDKVVKLEWEANATPIFSGYWIEKSLDGGQQFVPTNNLPILPSSQKDQNRLLAFHQDNLLENFQRVVYRVRGRTVFGALSPPSDTVSGYGRPKRLQASIGIDRIEEVEDKKLKISWDFPAASNQHLEGFELLRSKTKQGPYFKINTAPLKAIDRSFIDISPYTSGYYKVIARDIYGYTYESFSRLGQLEDQTPPAPPVGLTGKLDKEGKVTLNWSPNTEGDLMGYRVFRSNQKEGFYNQVTSYFTRDTFYSHEVDMNTTTNTVYYKVIALDFRENYSDKSKFCEIKRPNLTPPIPPVFRQALPKEDGVLLSWTPSSSLDVTQHQVQRKKTSDEDWKVVFNWGENETFTAYKDSNLTIQVVYNYRVVAIDSVGLESHSKVVRVSQLDKGKRSMIENFQVKLTSQQSDVQLRWTYPPANSLYQFVIYRSTGGGPLRTIHTLRLDQESYSGSAEAAFQAFQYDDNNIDSNQTYTYQIIAKHKDGGLSPLSPVRSIQIN